MDFAWAETSGNDWKAELFGDLETWLSEQHTQLRAHLEGVKSQAHPALPTQMSLEALRHDVHDVWAGVNGNEWPDDMYCDLETWLAELYQQLKGLKDAPTNTPAHPEFLETEADYQKAPEGTIVALDGSRTIWLKKFGAWRNTAGDHGVESACIALDSRRILRWRWGK